MPPLFLPPDPTPDEFLLHFPPDMRILANEVRALVKQHLPASFEAVKRGWGLIGFYLPTVGKGKSIYVGFIIPHSDSVTLGFQHGILLDDPLHRLLGKGENLKRVRYFSFRSLDDLQHDDVAAWIKQAAELALMPAALRSQLYRANS